MAKKVLIVLGLNLLIILALAGRATVAQPSQDERPAVVCFVPEAELPPRPDAALPPSVVELKRDVAIPYRGITTFQANDQIGLVLQASSLQYPLWVNGLRCYLAPYPGSASSVVLQAHVYGLAGDAPGALLGSSDVLTASLGSAIDDYTLTFSAPVEIASPQAFLIALQYKSGSVGSTPAIVMDISHDIPRNVAFYRRGGEAWVEHYAKSWSDADDRPIPASEMGYPMLRAWVETSGGPSDISIQEASAADTTIGSSQAMGITGAGARPYLELGACGDRGNTRALLRFALPTAPVAGATPIAAAVRLYHNGRLTVTVPMTVTTYRATQDWGETIPSTGWYTHSAAYAEAYGSDDIPARNPAETRQDYLLQLDVSQLVIKWYQGTYPEQGMMLIGNEDVANGCKELQSREYQSSAMRPKLVVQWALPAATPYGTPGPTVTHTPTRTLQPTPSYTPSTTPTGLPTSTRTATPTRTLTITPGGPTLTPATRGLHLPMIRKG